MPTQISGYEENDASKSSALKEITVTTVGNKSGVDVNVIASVNNRDDLIGGGKVSVGTTAVEVTFASTTNSIIITADADNTGKLFIGKSNVTNLGANAMTFLEAGDSLTLQYDDSDNAIFVVSDTASQYFWKGAVL